MTAAFIHKQDFDKYDNVKLPYLIRKTQKDIEILNNSEMKKKYKTSTIAKKKRTLYNRKKNIKKRLEKYDKDNPNRFKPGYKIIFKRVLGVNIIRKEGEVVNIPEDGKVHITLDGNHKQTIEVKPKNLIIKYLE